MKKLVFILFALFSFLSAKTIIVGNCQSGDATYSTISNAITNASDGDDIKICPATYLLYSTLIIDKKDLTIEGLGNNIDDTVLKGFFGNYIIRITSQSNIDTVIKNIKIIQNNSSANAAVYANGNSNEKIRFQNIIIESETKGIQLDSGIDCGSNIKITSKKGAIDVTPKSNTDIYLNGLDITVKSDHAIVFNGDKYVNITISNSNIITNSYTNYHSGIYVNYADKITVDGVYAKGRPPLWLSGNVKEYIVKNSIFKSTATDTGGAGIVTSGTNQGTSFVANTCFYGNYLVHESRNGTVYNGNYYNGVTDEDNDGDIDADDGSYAKIWGHSKDTDFKTSCDITIDTTKAPDDCPCCGEEPENTNYFQNNYTCGIFPSALTSYDEIKTKNNNINNTCKISVKDYNLEEDENKQITCYDENNDLCSCNSSHCSANNTCEIIDAPKNRLNYTVYETTKNDEHDESGNSFTFTDLEYGDYDLQTNQVSFEPTVTYEDDNNKKLILLGDVVFDKNNQTISLNEGDYYFKSLTINKNNIKICPHGNIRIFVKDDFNISGNNFSGDSSCNGKIFVYAEDDVELSGNGGGQTNIPILLYAKDDVTINNNSNSAQWYGAITAEGDIEINGNNFNFTYDKDAAKSFGYGECQLCYALNNNNGAWISFGNFYNGQFDFPRTMAIINDSDEELKNVKVVENEDLSGLSGKDACYYIVDEHKEYQDDKNIKIDVSGTNIGAVCYGPSLLPPPFFCPGKACITDIGAGSIEINVTSDFGDYTNGGYDDYLAVQMFNISDQLFGGKNLKYFADYDDQQGRHYDNVELGYCENIPTNEDNSYTTGPFDAWDDAASTRGINDRNISTKIVNQDFNLTIASINAANNAVEVKEGIDFKYQLYDMDTNTSITAWQDYNASTGADGKKAIKLFQNITSTHKDVRVRFKFCAYNNGAGLIVKNLSECDSTSSDYNASYELNTSTYSSDAFAIRPYAFRVFGENQYKRAGEDFNLTIKAVDEGNNSLASGTALNVIGIQNYNESTASLNIVSQTYMPNATDINQMLTDVFGTSTSHTAAEINTCPQAGTFTVTPNNFINGESNVSMKFSETGILDVNVSEKPGSEFAIIDTDDTNNSQRYIKPATNINDESNITANNILLFTPYFFVTTAEYNATNGKNWLYMSYDVHKSNTTYTTPKMAAYISYTIEAKNKQGNKVRNYTKTCFPDTDEVHAPRVNGLKLNTTFDLFLDADINSSADANISLYTEDNANNAVWVLNKNQTIFEHNNTLQEWISPLNFTNGIGKVKVYFNIDRNISHALKPIKITLIDANTSTSWMNNPGSPKDFNGTILNQSKTFYYGRVHAPDYSTQGDSIDAKIYYEVYCEDCNQTYLNSLNLGDESADSVFWYVNKNHTSTNDGNISGFVTTSKINPITKINPINNGLEDDNITYNAGIYPYKEKIEINASSWLIYNPYNPTATINDFSVEFLGGGGWAGIGTTGKTVDLNISTKGSKRIEW